MLPTPFFGFVGEKWMTSCQRIPWLPRWEPFDHLGKAVRDFPGDLIRRKWVSGSSAYPPPHPWFETRKIPLLHTLSATWTCKYAQFESFRTWTHLLMVLFVVLQKRASCQTHTVPHAGEAVYLLALREAFQSQVCSMIAPILFGRFSPS